MERIKYILHHYKYRILLASFAIFLGLFSLMSLERINEYAVSSNTIFQFSTSVIILTAMIVSYGKYGRYTLLYGAISLCGLRIISPGNDPRIDAIIGITIIFFFMRLNVIIVKTLLQEKHISNDLLFGCIAGYVMIAISGFFLFMLLDSLYSQQGFTINSSIDHNRLFSLMYYSFTTLTTIGYGDIIPSKPLIQLVVMMYSILSRSYSTFVLAMVLKKFDGLGADKSIG